LEKMFNIVVYLVKQLVVVVFQQLIERRQVWRTKSTALATAKKCIDADCQSFAMMKPLHAGYAYSIFATTTDRKPVGQRHISHDSVGRAGRIASESSR